MKWFLSIVAVVTLAVGLAAGFFGHLAVMTAAFAGFVGLLIAANLDRIAEFKATKSGIEARTREVIARAENTLSELQVLARHVGELTLSLVMRSGRIGGYDDDEQERIKASVLDVLTKVGVPTHEVPSVLTEWNRFIEFDYGHFILGAHTVPDNADGKVTAEWKALRLGGILEVPTPEEIRTFLTKHGFMTDELNERLLDYEHFRQHRAHRRPDVWRERHQWGRLEKKAKAKPAT